MIGGDEHTMYGYWQQASNLHQDMVPQFKFSKWPDCLVVQLE